MRRHFNEEQHPQNPAQQADKDVAAEFFFVEVVKPVARHVARVAFDLNVDDRRGDLAGHVFEEPIEREHIDRGRSLPGVRRQGGRTRRLPAQLHPFDHTRHGIALRRHFNEEQHPQNPAQQADKDQPYADQDGGVTMTGRLLHEYSGYKMIRLRSSKHPKQRGLFRSRPVYGMI